MERARWTDERLDSEMERIDKNFDRVFGELRAEREAMVGQVNALRLEMRTEFGNVRADLSALHRQVTLILGGFAVALIGAIAVLAAALA
jgi:hypothetical protein